MNRAFYCASKVAEQKLPMKSVVLTLYTRHNCSLCEDMLYTLNDFSDELNFTVSSIDIDLDPATREQFNDLVPVLKLGDEEICHHFFDREALLQTLAAERTRH